MTLEDAIEMLKTEYEKAKKQKYIINPLAYALYQVWKEADSIKEEKQREYNRIAKQKSRAKRKEEQALKGGAE